MRRIPHQLLVGMSVLASAGAGVLFVVQLLGDGLETDELFVIVGLGVFTIIGALIEDRRPGNTIGRINLATAFLLALCAVLRLVVTAMDAELGPLPPVAAALAVVSSVGFAVALIGGSLALIARYPDGPVPGPLGKLLDVLIVAALGAAAMQLFRPGPLEYGWVEAVPNPLGVDALRPVFDAGAAALLLAFAAGLALGIAGLIVRYRRAGERVRAQLRWFVAASTIPLCLLVLLFTSTGELNAWVWDAWLVSFLLVPVAIGIGILRYRLYDIDRIISRTLAYGLVTALMAGVFVSVNLALGSVIASVTAGSSAAVAASTLAAAALFQPLRRAIQAPIDRRFNRSRVDAEETIRIFGDQVRDEVDLGRLVTDVRGAVVRTLRPEPVGLWLRQVP
jgi:hypothetical protein